MGCDSWVRSCVTAGHDAVVQAVTAGYDAVYNAVLQAVTAGS